MSDDNKQLIHIKCRDQAHYEKVKASHEKLGTEVYDLLMVFRGDCMRQLDSCEPHYVAQFSKNIVDQIDKALGNA